MGLLSFAPGAPFTALCIQSLETCIKRINTLPIKSCAKDRDVKLAT